MLRHLLYEAASALMTRCCQPSLQAWVWRLLAEVEPGALE
jgi:hypothetical protein